MVGLDQPRALEHGDRRQIALPPVGEDRRGAALVEPLQLVASQGEDAAQDDLAHGIRVALGVGQRERRAPRAAEDLPLLDAEVAPQQLDVGDQVPGGVEAQVGVGRAHVGRGLPAAALVEQHDPVLLRVEEPPVPRGGARTGTPVQEHDRLAVGVAGLLPVDALPVAGQQVPGLVRLDVGVEDVVQVGGAVHSSPPDTEKVSQAPSPF